MNNENIANIQSQKSRRAIEILKSKVSVLRSVVYISLAVSFLVTCLFVFWIYQLYYASSVETYYSIAPKTPVAYLYLSPENGNYKIGQEFAVDVLLNTAGSSVNAASAFLSYDKTKMEVLSIDVTGSVFDMTAQTKIIPDFGKVKIVLGTPTPGIRTQKGNRVRMATINFRAINKVNPVSENISFDFIKGTPDYSAVFLDDKKGTDILDATRGAKIFIN